MKLKIDAKELQSKLKALAVAVEGKTTIPVLGCVLVDADSKQATATDLNVFLRVFLNGEFTGSGQILIPHSKTLALVSTMSGEVVLEGDGKEVLLRSGRSKVKLLTFEASSFPKLDEPTTQGTFLPLGTLKNMVERTQFGISKEESRYTLSGALLKIAKGQVLMVATDGHRMPIVESKTDAVADFAFLLPVRAMNALAQLTGESVAFSENESTMFFETDTEILTSRKLSGTFPNYESVLPKEHEIEVAVPVEKFKDVVERVALMADKTTPRILLSLAESTLKLTAESAESGTIEDALDVKPSGAGKEISIAFNARYVLDFLTHVDGGEIRLQFKDALSAGDMYAGNDYRYLIMPLR